MPKLIGNIFKKAKQYGFEKYKSWARWLEDKQKWYKNEFEKKVSKKLTAKQRESAFEEISKKAVIGIGIIDNYYIDKINIANATIMAMRQALFNLFIEPDFVLIDGILDIGLNKACRYIVSGDSKSLSIAAASIVAKVTRDNLMLKYHIQFPVYNFINNKGYGTKAHICALQIKGPCRIHRRSFKPVGGFRYGGVGYGC